MENNALEKIRTRSRDPYSTCALRLSPVHLLDHGPTINFLYSEAAEKDFSDLPLIGQAPRVVINSSCLYITSHFHARGLGQTDSRGTANRLRFLIGGSSFPSE